MPALGVDDRGSVWLASQEQGNSGSFEAVLVSGVCAFLGCRFQGWRLPGSPEDERAGSGKANNIHICSLTFVLVTCKHFRELTVLF